MQQDISSLIFMFAALARYRDKIIVGNRAGKVFVANASWLTRRPEMWRLVSISSSKTVCLFQNFDPRPYLRAPDEDDVITCDIPTYLVHCRLWQVTRYPELQVWCGYDKYTWQWWVYYP